MRRTQYLVDNGDGWHLDVNRYRAPGRQRSNRPPLLFIPGYCMNTFILAFHPSGRSMVEFLTVAGYDVWTVNLRGQGDARRYGPRRTVTLTDWCDVDVPKAVAHVLDHAGAPSAILIGCSLGGSVAYGYLARRPAHHRLCAAVAIGAPLRWPALPPWARPLLWWPQALGQVPLRGTRRLARSLLPVATKMPRLLSIYMNPAHVDLQRADILTRTVDDPEPGINEALIRWIKARDLFIGPTNVTEGLGQADLPLLAIWANGDGIVPTSIAASVIDHGPSGQVTTMEVGDDTVRFAHADMFISHHAESRVFAPMTRWLDAIA